MDTTASPAPDVTEPEPTAQHNVVDTTPCKSVSINAQNAAHGKVVVMDDNKKKLKDEYEKQFTKRGTPRMIAEKGTAKAADETRINASVNTTLYKEFKAAAKHAHIKQGKAFEMLMTQFIEDHQPEIERSIVPR